MPDLWELVWGKAEIDPETLAGALERAADQDRLDFRTRLLIRDATDVLQQFWGKDRLEIWLKRTTRRAAIETIRGEDLGDPGFLLTKEQLVEQTKAETVQEFLRDLGLAVAEPSTLRIGGAIALILSGYIARSTTDIDVVDEVPDAIRNQRELLDELRKRYRLQLTHFQSRYLPSGWENRLHFLDFLGQLRVYTVDVYDLFLGKLFSKRVKDLDDLREMKPKIDRLTLVQRLRDTAAAFVKEPALRQSAEKNWYVLYGEPFPPPG